MKERSSHDVLSLSVSAPLIHADPLLISARLSRRRRALWMRRPPAVVAVFENAGGAVWKCTHPLRNTVACALHLHLQPLQHLYITAGPVPGLLPDNAIRADNWPLLPHTHTLTHEPTSFQHQLGFSRVKAQEISAPHPPHLIPIHPFFGLPCLSELARLQHRHTTTWKLITATPWLNQPLLARENPQDTPSFALSCFDSCWCHSTHFFTN